MQKKMLYLAIIFSRICADQTFDLKKYERALKPATPWSLSGSAQDLRSDAKHQLQLILRAFIFLRPDVSWDSQQKPDAKILQEGVEKLKSYLALEGNESKRPWVVDSLSYIVDTYAGQVQQALDEVGQTLPHELIEQRKELLKEFSEILASARADMAKKQPVE